MANHKSALKRVRQIKTRTERNRIRKNAVKKLRKEVSSAIETGDQEKSQEALSKFYAAVDKAAKRGVFHRNKAANLKSKVALSVAEAAK